MLSLQVQRAAAVARDVTAFAGFASIGEGIFGVVFRLLAVALPVVSPVGVAFARGMILAIGFADPRSFDDRLVVGGGVLLACVFGCCSISRSIACDCGVAETPAMIPSDPIDITFSVQSRK